MIGTAQLPFLDDFIRCYSFLATRSDVTSACKTSLTFLICNFTWFLPIAAHF